MNIVTLSGRLTKDPEIRYSNGEKPMCVARFTLAVDKNYKREGDTANFINCTAFAKTGEVIEKHVTKGTKIMVTGEWTTGSYTNKDGNKVYTNECNVSKLEFCESKNSSSDAQPGNDAPFMAIPDGIEADLPFH